MTQSNAVVVLTPEQLRELVTDAVREALESKPEPAEWLDTAGAAAVLQVHPRTVGKMAKSGELPATRVGRMWRFRRADLDAYLAGKPGA